MTYVDISTILVMFSDTTQHILSSNSAEKDLINYSKILLKLQIILYFKHIHSVYPSGWPESSSITVHYSTFVALQLTLTCVTVDWGIWVS